MARIWRDYSLSIILFGLFFSSWMLQTYTGWREFAAERKSEGDPAHWLGPDGYIWTWGSATMENWQSEFLQLMTFVVLTAYFVHKGSHESKDSDDKMMAKLDRIEARIASLEERRQG